MKTFPVGKILLKLFISQHQILNFANLNLCEKILTGFYFLFFLLFDIVFEIIFDILEFFSKGAYFFMIKLPFGKVLCKCFSY